MKKKNRLQRNAILMVLGSIIGGFLYSFDQILTMKGQSLMEYLITYGWAFLIVIVVLLALWYISVFG